MKKSTSTDCVSCFCLHEKKISLQQLREIYQSAMNYCIKKINNGKQPIFQNAFRDLQNHPSEKNPDDGWVSSPVRLQKYSHHCFADERASMGKKNSSRSTSCFYEKKTVKTPTSIILHTGIFHNREYSKTLVALSAVKFTDVYYQFDTRSILLKNIFRTG